ncbi:membrane hypothetical protein [Vibrio chagasii]|nr:membrane hypothetical protein [Vibrio chagasii]
MKLRGATLESIDSKLLLVWCLLFCSLICLTPFSMGSDITQHGAQVAVINDLLFDRATILTEYFELDLKTPYLTAYFIATLLSLILTVDSSFKLMTLVSILLSVFYLKKISEDLSATQGLTALFLPIQFGFSYHWGHISFTFCLWMAFAVIHYVLNAISLGDTKANRGKVLVLLIGIGFGHPIVLAITCFSLLSIVFYNKNNLKLMGALVESIPFVAVGIVVVAWLFMATGNTPDSTLGIQWLYTEWDITNAIGGFLGLSVYKFYWFFGFFVILMPFLLGYRFSTKRHLFGFILVTVMVCLTPSVISGALDVRQRLYLFIPVAFLLSIKPVEKSKATPFAVSLLLALPFTVLLLDTLKVSEKQKAFLSLISEIPDGQLVLSRMVNDNIWANYDVRGKITIDEYNWFAVYQMYSRGVVDYNFASLMAPPVSYKAGMSNYIQGESDNPYMVFLHHGYELDHYNYIIDLDYVNVNPAQFSSNFELLNSSPPFHLWRRLEEGSDGLR